MVLLTLQPELKARIKLAAIREHKHVEEWLSERCDEAEIKYEKSKNEDVVKD